MAQPTTIAISALPPASAPLAADVLPVVQGGVTKKQSVEALRTWFEGPFASPGGASKVGFLPSGPGAAATTVETKLREYRSVADKGAEGTGLVDASAALNSALADRVNGWALVRFPAGKWLINNQIRLREKTVLVLEAGAEVLHNAVDEMLFINGEVGNTTYATGYNGDGDIYILGPGAVNLQATGGYRGMARFAHAQNIVLGMGLEIRNGYRAHMVEFNSLKHARCLGVTFRDHLSPVGETNFETLQIDHATAGGLPEFGAPDLTPCIDVVVRDCQFLNVWSAFGSHSDPDATVGLHDSIHFMDNLIDGFRGMPWKAQGFKNSTFLRNTVRGGAADARGPVIWSCSEVLVEANNLDMSGISLGLTVGVSGSLPSLNIKVDLNTIQVGNVRPILVSDCTGGSVNDNTILNSTQFIDLAKAWNMEVTGNRYRGGAGPTNLVRIQSACRRNNLTDNTGPFTTARYSTDDFGSEIDGEVKLASGSFASGTAVTLVDDLNTFRQLTIGSGSVGAGTFRTQNVRGFTSVGFQLGTTIHHTTADGVIILTVDTATQVTVTSQTGTAQLRFIYGVERR